MLDEDSEIRSMNIGVYENTDPFPERTASLQIDDDETMARLMEDFSSLRLKRIDGFPREYSHAIEITKTDEIEENFYETRSFRVTINDGTIAISGQRYAVESEPKYLETLRELEESDELQWRDY